MRQMAEPLYSPWVCARSNQLKNEARDAGAFLDKIDRQFDQGRIAECQVGWPLSVGWVRSLLGLVAASSMVKPAASAAVEATLVASASEPSLWLLVLGFIVLCSGFAFIAGILVGKYLYKEKVRASIGVDRMCGPSSPPIRFNEEIGFSNLTVEGLRRLVDFARRSGFRFTTGGTHKDRLIEAAERAEKQGYFTLFIQEGDM